MNDTPTTTDTSPSGSENLESQVSALQRQVTLLTLGLLVVSGTFCGYMGLMARRARHDLQSLNTAAAPAIKNFQQQKAQWDDFVKKVTEYGSTHSDFAPIMTKYNLTATNAGSAPGGVAQPQSSSTEPVLPK